jgi:hypothetical protein
MASIMFTFVFNPPEADKFSASLRRGSSSGFFYLFCRRAALEKGFAAQRLIQKIINISW